MKRKPLSFISKIGIRSELDFFIENLTTLSASGVDMVTALRALKEEFKTARMKKVLDQVIEDISSGVPLWRSLEFLQIFPASSIFLIRSGEENGRLSDNLRVLNSQRQKEIGFHDRLRSAMLYPMLVIIVMMVVGIGIAWFVLPKLTTVFSNLKVDVPPLTQFLIDFGNFLKEYGYIAVPAFIFSLILFFYIIFFFPYTRFIGQAFLLFVPGIKTLIKQIEVTRFSYILGQLLSAGVPIVPALSYLPQSTNIVRYKKLYRFLEKSISEGNTFHKSFQQYKKSAKLIPFSVQQILVTAEQVGNLQPALLGIAHDNDSKIEHTAKNLTTILEPVLLLVVWFGVMVVALAIIMPIYGLLNSAQY